MGAAMIGRYLFRDLPYNFQVANSGVLGHRGREKIFPAFDRVLEDAVGRIEDMSKIRERRRSQRHSFPHDVVSHIGGEGAFGQHVYLETRLLFKLLIQRHQIQKLAASLQPDKDI